MEITSMHLVLQSVNNFMMQLDAYTSILMAVIEFRLVPPILKEGSSSTVRISKSRNLLIEYQKKYVRQEYSMRLGSTTVVGGNNGSGKSIYLRTLGNIVLLA